MVVIDRMYFVEGDYENYVLNKKARVENSFNQIFKELGLPLPVYYYELNDDGTDVEVEIVRLGVYNLNVRVNAVSSTIREITKFVVEYQRSDSCYYTGDILNRGIVGLYKNA